MLHREHPRGSPEARLHLVGDEDDPVFIADPAQALDELFRGREEPSLPLLRLEDDRSDVIRETCVTNIRSSAAIAASAPSPR